MRVRSDAAVTHTYALMQISQAAYAEICAKMRNAGYDHAFNDDGEIDMHGIAVVGPGSNKQWRPISTAPKDIVALFWIRPGTVADGNYFVTTSGKPIITDGPPRILMCRYGTWSSLSVATHWAPLPEPPDA